LGSEARADEENGESISDMACHDRRMSDSGRFSCSGLPLDRCLGVAIALPSWFADVEEGAKKASLRKLDIP
jgi:hypothetical protein